ncbi:MAG: hypothetical protein Q4G68_09070 [Planctomycetia bacterium]|nr:hypothetical protein [Planctomycetia bacterium]
MKYPVWFVSLIVCVAFCLIGSLKSASGEEAAPERSLFEEFRESAMADVHEILFVVRKPGTDPHWYANFSYYAGDENTYPFPLGTGAKMCILNLDTREVRTILETATGSIRDPQIHYEGKKVLFSYFPDGQKHYNLYEMNLDGSDLRQLTFGDWDDIEPSYLPCGDLVFCSNRCKKWVQCWLTQVANIYRCGPNGEDMHAISANPEQDNTPWVLPNGQIIYMRWEYIDRSQVHYHHLWTMNPDGTRQQVYYGNLRPGLVMLGTKPIPDSEKVVSIFSPGHGIREHSGPVAVVSPKNGPDAEDEVRIISKDIYSHRDPWPFSEDAFLVAKGGELQLLRSDGREEVLYSQPQPEGNDGWWVHEPRPLITREREPIIADNTDPDQTTGTLILANIYDGRRMKDLPKGTVKELLVLETLPIPIHYHGGMGQVTYGGTFTLQRILGTVPVRPDGSASMELPAMRPVFFVALDHEGKPVKRMHSFTSVMPGETTVCIGCHESRTEAPANEFDSRLFELAREKPIPPQPIAGIPDVFDFVRDIQPILDRHCVECHNYERRDANVDLSGTWNILMSQSYLTLTWREMFGDNRNRPQSDFAPYEIGSCASHLYELIEKEHQGVKLNDDEKKMVRFWLDSGAVYAGTYAANAHTIQDYYYESPLEPDKNWPELAAMNDVLSRRCDGCHDARDRRLPHRICGVDNGKYDPYRLFNLTAPDRAAFVRAPLSQEAGGSGICKGEDGKVVFESKDDPDWQKLLAVVARARHYLTDESQRFCFAEKIVPPRPYVREMIRYGILPPDHDYKTPINPYETDQRYWQSLWYTPPAHPAKP